VSRAVSIASIISLLDGSHTTGCVDTIRRGVSSVPWSLKLSLKTSLNSNIQLWHSLGETDSDSDSDLLYTAWSSLWTLCSQGYPGTHEPFVPSPWTPTILLDKLFEHYPEHLSKVGWKWRKKILIVVLQ
jgi:hypothetical protein